MRGITEPNGRPLGGSELLSYFSPLVVKATKVYRIKFVCAGVSVVCNADFRLTVLLRSDDTIRDQVAKLCEIRGVCRKKIAGMGTNWKSSEISSVFPCT